MNTAWWSKPTYTGDYSGIATIGGLPAGTLFCKERCTPETDLDFYCDPCDKSFKLASQLAAHVEQHVQCHVAGCSFSACHRVVQEHTTIAHSSTGKMIALDSPEDIARWREARRLNWPSKENMKRKLDELQGKQQRGELLPSERTAKNSRQKACSSWQVRTSNVSTSSDRFSGSGISISQEEDSKQPNDSLSSLLAYSSDSSDNSPLMEAQDNLEFPELASSRIVTNVSSTVDKEDPNSSFLSNVQNDHSRNQKRICKFFAKGHCTKGRWCKFVHESTSKSESTKFDGYQYHGSVVRRGPCLLHKLLSSENDRETSRILQCLRHLVSAGKLE